MMSFMPDACVAKYRELQQLIDEEMHMASEAMQGVLLDAYRAASEQEKEDVSDMLKDFISYIGTH